MAPRSSAQRIATIADNTVYPVEERVGEELLQRLIVELLRPLIERFLASRRVLALTGADQFIYFRRRDARYRVAPDVFVLPGVSPRRRIRSWKIWEERIRPSFALEVVSLDVDKDYFDAPVLYDVLGVPELVIFDPDFAQEPGRHRFQVFRRVRGRGLVRVEVTSGDRVRSKALGCWLRSVGRAESTRLRLALGPSGDELVPTDAELVARERAEKERERAEKERERAEKERERAEKEREHTGRVRAERQVARLRAALARRRRAR